MTANKHLEVAVQRFEEVYQQLLKDTYLNSLLDRDKLSEQWRLELFRTCASANGNWDAGALKISPKEKRQQWKEVAYFARMFSRALRTAGDGHDFKHFKIRVGPRTNPRDAILLNTFKKKGQGELPAKYEEIVQYIDGAIPLVTYCEGFADTIEQLIENGSGFEYSKNYPTKGGKTTKRQYLLRAIKNHIRESTEEKLAINEIVARCGELILGEVIQPDDVAHLL